MSTLKTSRFVMRKSLVGKGLIIEVSFKNGKKVKYDHDKVFEVMKSKLESLECWTKYKTYTSSSNMPLAARELIIE